MTAGRTIKCPTCKASLSLPADSTAARFTCPKCTTSAPIPPPTAGRFSKGAVFGIAAMTFALGGLGGCAVGCTIGSSMSESKADKFIQVIRDGGIELPREQAIKEAHGVCDALERRPSLTRSEVVMAATIRENIDPTKAGTFVGASIGAYCPEFRDRPWE